MKQFYSTACRESWTPPSNWTARDQPSVYRSFENENHCLELINGASLVPGRVSDPGDFLFFTKRSTITTWFSLDLMIINFPAQLTISWSFSIGDFTNTKTWE